MSTRKSRFGLLFLGIFIGILAGASFAFWLNYMEWDFSKVKKFFKTSDEETKTISELKPVNVDTSDIVVTRPRSKFLSRKLDSIEHNSEELSLEEFLELYKDEYPDSVLINAYQLNAENKVKDISVAADEMIYVKLVDVDGIIEDKNEVNLDSLLLDDRESKPQHRSVVKVEFWKSPINYQGYKWDMRKLVLFGFYEFDFVRIKFLNDHYYMKYGTLYYQLNQGDSFQNLSLVGDNDLIRQLNAL